ncbi:MAG: hypothetical protein OXH57_03660 [Ekhidna sp.]|nr:hypothetical protein [Ekhidna sp.]
MKTFKITFLCLLGLNYSCSNNDSPVNDIDNEITVPYEKGLFSKTLMEIDLSQPLNFNLFKAKMIANSIYPENLTNALVVMETGANLPIPFESSSLFIKTRGVFEPLSIGQVFAKYEFSELGQSYFQRIINIIPDEDIEDESINFDQIYESLDAITEEYSVDPNLEASETEALNQATIFFKGEVEGLVEFVDNSLIGSNEKARCRFFCKVWRGVKSVVTWAAVGTVASVITTFGGAAVALPGVAAFWGFWGVMEIVYSNRCAGKFSCLLTLYDCSTGECTN